MQHEHEPQSSRITFEQITTSAQERLLATGSHPSLLLLDGDANLVGVELDFPSTADQRQALMYLAGISTAITGIAGNLQQVFLISEAWMSGVEPNQHNIVMPSQDPTRREILQITSYQFENRQPRVAVIEMLRDSNQVLRELKDITAELTDDPHQPSPLLDAFVDGYTQGLASRT